MGSRNGKIEDDICHAKEGARSNNQTKLDQRT